MNYYSFKIDLSGNPVFNGYFIVDTAQIVSPGYNLITAFYDGTSFLTKITPRPTSIVKFAVNDASQDAITAEPNFITATGTKEITVDGSAVPIQGTYYDGSGFIISNSQAFDTSALNLATARIIIVEEGVINFNVLDSIITESHLPPTGGVDGNYWIQTNPLKTYKRIAGVWTLTRFVKLGEYPTSASGVVGTIRCYSFNRLSSHKISTTFSPITINHNIGTDNISTKRIVARCIQATANCTVGKTYEVQSRDGTVNLLDTKYINSIDRLTFTAKYFSFMLLVNDAGGNTLFANGATNFQVEIDLEATY